MEMTQSLLGKKVKHAFQEGDDIKWILRNEGILDEIRRRMYYEKPFEMRRRVSFERCRRIYSADMGRKIQFVMRKNRVDPSPR